MANDSKVSFEGFSKPALQSGEVTFTSTVAFSIESGKHLSREYPNELHLFVAGPRFSLPPSDIHSVFPPRDALGQFDNVMPHIELNINNLPWQRSSGYEKGKTPTPWLGLLLLQEEEWTDSGLVTSQKLKWEEYQALINKDGRGTKQKLAEEITDKAVVSEEQENKELPPVKVLKIKRKLAEQLLPNTEALSNLTHIRIGHDQRDQEVERSIIVCNRLPKAGTRAEVHLVSLEMRYDEEGNFIYPEEDEVPFVSIYSWQFACNNDEQFKVSDKAIGRLPKSLKKKTSKAFPEEQARDVLYRGKTEFQQVLKNNGFSAAEIPLLVNACHIRSETFKGLMDALDLQWVHLPTPSGLDKKAEKQFEVGSVPLAHGLRQGGKTASWYRGPLIADKDIHGNVAEKFLEGLPTRSADHLLLYHKSTAMLDTSYATAWNLGRLLSISDPAIAQQIATWKTSHAREIALVQQNKNFSHLPFLDADFVHKKGGPLEEKLLAYLTDLSLLKGVPFNYLVPHEELLPDETLRFFHFDVLWLASLLDGAFSIGRTTQMDVDQEKADEEAQLPNEILQKHRMGVLLRSDLVAGWPSLQVEAYADAEKSNKLKTVRFDRLGFNVLLVLFDLEPGQVLSKLTLHLPPQSLHFGFSRPGEDDKPYFKEVKDIATGRELNNVTVDVKFKGSADLRIVDINLLRNDLNAKLSNKITHAGKLAVELIEGVPLLEVSFTSSK